MEYERHEFTQPLYGGVNVLRIGTTMVDTGHVAPVSRDAVDAALDAELADVERVLITHPHIDHVGGSQTLDRLADLPHIVPSGSLDIIHDYASYLQRARSEMSRLLSGFGMEDDMWDGYFPIRTDYAETRLNVERELADGEKISIGGYDIEAISTPGHANPHLAFFHRESRTLFSGDLVDADGRFQYGPLLGDVGEYKQSLRRIRDLDPDVLVPMHGPSISDPQASIQESLESVETTETRLLEFRSENAPYFAREFVTDELGVFSGKMPFLTLVIYEYLSHLSERGLLDIEVTDEGIRVY